MMNGIGLENVVKEKYLGVIIKKDVTFHHHVSTAVTKANQALGLIKHTFTTLDEVALPLLFKFLVRPVLEYANLAWNPS